MALSDLSAGVSLEEVNRSLKATASATARRAMWRESQGGRLSAARRLRAETKILVIENNSHMLLLQMLRRSESAAMYICICNAIRETDLRRAALMSGGDAEATYGLLGKRPNCGQCLGEAGQIIDQERALSSCENLAL
jgi:bacterioferritin-associated ferredoxin